jgi:DNA-directed RNA polymerase subunit M/transcription elongation factor TFIIS
MQASPSLVDCQSCGEQNGSDMAFCLNCGKVLSSSVQAQRDIQGVKKRQCKSCGRADELNNRYCIFCGADIKTFVAKAANPEALARFTSELSQFEAESVDALRPDEPLERSGQNNNSPTTQAGSHTGSQAGSPTVYKTKSVGKPSHSPLSIASFILLGLLSGSLLAYAFNGPTLAEAYNILNLSAQKEGLLIYTKQPTVRVVLESKDRTHYTVGQTNKGSLVIPDIDPGFHRVIMTVPGSDSIVETVDLLKSKLNIIGYDKKVDATGKLGK